MNEKFATLYHEMLKDLERMMEQDLPEENRISNGFWVAAQYWDELKRRVGPDLLIDLEAAIDFFRNVKPKFTGYIQYFTIVSEALLFVPESNINRISYWEEELKRCDFFCNKHQEFVEYYKSGRTDMDAVWFTQAPDDSLDLHPIMTYDKDRKFCSTHDALIRGIVAHELYRGYVSNALKRVKEVETKKG